MQSNIPFSKVRAWKSNAMARLRAIWYQSTVNMSACLRLRSLNVPGCCGLSKIQWIVVVSCTFHIVLISSCLFQPPKRSLSLHRACKHQSSEVKQSLCNDLCKSCLRYLSWTLAHYASQVRIAIRQKLQLQPLTAMNTNTNRQTHTHTCKPRGIDRMQYSISKWCRLRRKFQQLPPKRREELPLLHF